MISNFLRSLLGILLLTGCAAAQIIPDHYVVRLSDAPIGADVRAQGRTAMSARTAQLHAAQARVGALVQQHNGRVVASLDNLLNALLVRIPDANAP